MGCHWITRRGCVWCTGALTFGSTSAPSHFEDNGKTIVFTDKPVGSTFLKLNVVGSSGNTNVFKLGSELGSGESIVGINGCSFISPNVNVSIDFIGTNINTLDIFGSTFKGFGNTSFILSNNVAHKFISNTITNCGKITANSVIIRNLLLSNSSNSVGGILWSNTINIKNSTFLGNASSIEHNDATNSPFTYDNMQFSANTNDINNTSGVAIVINSVNGSNPVTSTGSAVTINNPITFELTGLIPDTEVRIFRDSDMFELAGIENSTTIFQYNYNYIGDINVYIVIHKEEYEYIILEDIVLGQFNSSIPIQQRLDRNFLT